MFDWTQIFYRHIPTDLGSMDRVAFDTAVGCCRNYLAFQWTTFFTKLTFSG